MKWFYTNRNRKNVFNSQNKKFIGMKNMQANEIRIKKRNEQHKYTRDVPSSFSSRSSTSDTLSSLMFSSSSRIDGGGE